SRGKRRPAHCLLLICEGKFAFRSRVRERSRISFSLERKCRRRRRPRRPNMAESFCFGPPGADLGRASDQLTTYLSSVRANSRFTLGYESEVGSCSRL